MVAKRKEIIEKLDQKITKKQAPDDEAIQSKIAEVAYYKAEKRGFEPSHEMEDWFEAENEIMSSDS